ncbi:MAG: dprA [Bacteroidota bacterium]|nr:dprA [Bacteroidota bacterium]
MSKSASQNLLYQVAFTMLPNVGSMVAKNLIAYCGSPEAVFKTSKQKLLKIPLVGEERAESIVKADLLKEAEQELKFIEDFKIKTFFFTEEDYPARLKPLVDNPILLYYKGDADLNAPKTVGIVGTRKCTDYGKEITKKIVAELAAHDVMIISGLAYGIDIAAHNAALENNLKTVGVLAHGLNTLYPAQHKPAAKRMVAQGGLLTEYKSLDEMRTHNFPQRNRIVAGLCDAVIVVESAIKGGAVITANIANSYNKDVFSLPGRATDKVSAGCNFLIKTYKASLIENGNDLLEAMRWNTDGTSKKQTKQQRLPLLDLADDEKAIYSLLSEKGEVEIDKLVQETGMNSSLLAASLLEMEMNGIIVSLPGKRYKLI